jgi:membrane protease YdiL (CAAX protease family)
MTRAAFGLWSRVLVLSATAWITLAMFDPPRPAATMPPLVAIAFGLVAGTALFVALTRGAPVLPSAASGARLALARHLFLGLCAVNEELVWRRLVLGEALRAGVVGAVIVSTVGFAIVHRARQGTQLALGAGFATVYVATGSLAAAVAAHWTYNTHVAAAIARAPTPTRETT